MTRKSKQADAQLFVTQQRLLDSVGLELFDCLPDEQSTLRDQRPRSPEALTPVLQMLHTLGAVSYAQRAQLVCLLPAMLPQVCVLFFCDHFFSLILILFF